MADLKPRYMRVKRWSKGWPNLKVEAVLLHGQRGKGLKVVAQGGCLRTEPNLKVEVVLLHGHDVHVLHLRGKRKPLS